MVLNQRMLGSVAVFLGIGAIIYAGAVLWSGSAAVLDAASRIGPSAVLIGAAVGSSGYLMRFLRWHWLLIWLGHPVPVALNVRVYLAGLALTTSPGKLGETIRSLLLLPHGVGV